MVTGRRLRIIYFGTPDFAVPPLLRLLSSEHSVLAVVSQPDRPKGRGHQRAATPTKTVAQAAGVPVLQPERIRDDDVLSSLAALSPDLGVVAAYGKLLPDALLQIPPLGMINVHASLLPAWRGAAPVHRAVIAGDRETGVTIMRVIKELDAGPTFATARYPVDPDETSVEVERALAGMGAELLLDVINQLSAARAVETRQDDGRATYAPKIRREDGIIDWTAPAERIHNLIRGLQPWPLVSARLHDQRVLMHRTTLPDERTSARPGTVARADGGVLDIAAGDGRIVRVLQIQPEARRVMTAREFLAGRHIAPGTPIEPA